MSRAIPCRLAAGLLALSTAAAVTAQQSAPVYNVLQFKFTVAGKGSDPNPSDANNPPSVPAKAIQDWSYSRVIEGWYEVDATPPDRAGRIRFKPRRDGRHAISGTRGDVAGQTYMEAGEGSDVVGHGTYAASERWDADAKLGPPNSSLVMELNTKEATWTTAFLPIAWLTELDTKAGYRGLAAFQSPKGSGLGEDWHFATDSIHEEPKGNAHLDTRYSPARRGMIPFPPALARTGCRAEYTQLDADKGGGSAVRGHVPFTIDKPRDVPGTFEMKGVLEWVVRVDLPDVELKVRIPDYGTWRPSAAPSMSGEPLRVFAQLRRSDPKKNTPLPKVRTFTWRLVGTSHEPGIAMNLPYSAANPDPTPDLLISGHGVAVQTYADEQKVIIHGPAGTDSQVDVIPMDWGGWGTLRVEALLVDGRVMHGELEGGPAIIGNQRDIPIPARIPGSHIAMGWLEEKGWPWKGDAEDSDPNPTSKVSGDGFTLYEEYRGFYWGKGGHLSTDPRTKDLFIRIEPAAAAHGTPAVAMFTGLAVHWTKQAEQLPGAAANRRTVNVNKGMGASLGPQTALYVTDQVSKGRINDLIKAGARPATVVRIDLPSAATIRRGDVPMVIGNADEDRLIALHQLTQAVLQACGVERPGPSDRVQRVTFVPGSNVPRPQRGAVDVVPPHMRVGENDCQILFADTDLATVYADQIARTGIPAKDFYSIVGDVGGAHSGPEDCVMRDWFADLYRTREMRGGFQIYRFAPVQKYGTRLGTTRAGTGINAQSRPGGSVFGDSNVAESASQQLVVKDRSP